MASGDLVFRRGTALVLAASGGDYALTLTSLVANAARQSAKIDFGATAAEWWEMLAEIESGTAPTAGKWVDFFLSRSLSATAGTSNVGGTGGTDAAYKAGEEAEWCQQLERIGSLISTNDGNTVQRVSLLFRPVTRYGSIVVLNSWNQALRDSATNHKLTLTPLIPQYQAS